MALRRQKDKKKKKKERKSDKDWEGCVTMGNFAIYKAKLKSSEEKNSMIEWNWDVGEGECGKIYKAL